MENYFWFDLLMFSVNVHIVSVRILRGKLSILKTVGAFSLFGLGVMLNRAVADDLLDTILGFFCIFLAFAAPLATIKHIKRFRILYMACLLFGVSYTLINSFQWIVLSFTDETYILFSVGLLIQLLFLFLLFTKNTVLMNVKHYIDIISVKLKTLLLVSVWISAAFAGFFSSYIVSSPRTLPLIVTECCAAAMVISIGIMWPFIFIGNAWNITYQAALNRLDGQIRAQVKHYELVIQAHKDLRDFKHGFDNIKVGLAAHLQNDDPRGALRFLAECEQSIQSEYISFQTGHLIADALLSEKQTVAKAGGAQITFDGLIPPGGLSSVDMCVILGNLLDNALEACEKLPGDKTVAISAYGNNGFLFLRVTNPVKEDVPTRGGTPETTKKDKEKHGMGLPSVHKAIRGYNGVIALSCADRVFTAEVTLDLNETEGKD